MYLLANHLLQIRYSCVLARRPFRKSSVHFAYISINKYRSTDYNLPGLHGRKKKQAKFLFIFHILINERSCQCYIRLSHSGVHEHDLEVEWIPRLVILLFYVLNVCCAYVSVLYAFNSSSVCRHLESKIICMNKCTRLAYIRCSNET